VAFWADIVVTVLSEYAVRSTTASIGLTNNPAMACAVPAHSRPDGGWVRIMDALKIKNRKLDSILVFQKEKRVQTFGHVVLLLVLKRNQ
jgi:hypothetical protein